MTKLIPKSYDRAYAILGAEFLFILLPFVVSALVFSNKGDYTRLIHSSEWSLAASVLIGQSLVKFISGMLANKDVYKAHWERVALAISFLIVFCLVPALIILCLVLIESNLSSMLNVLQIIMFAIGVCVFFVFGASGEALLRIKESTAK
jgi:ABC-type polysaccharide transport system permease subunit